MVIREGTNDVLMPALRDGDLDLVVGRLPEFRQRQGLAQERLVDEEICVVTRPQHPLVTGLNVEFAELAKYDWILPPPDTTLRREIDREFSDRDLPEPSCPVESISFLTNRSLLIATDMIGVMPYHVVEKEIQSGVLAVIKCELQMSAGPIGVSYRREGAMSPAAENFLDLLRDTARENTTEFST